MLAQKFIKSQMTVQTSTEYLDIIKGKTNKNCNKAVFDKLRQRLHVNDIALEKQTEDVKDDQAYDERVNSSANLDVDGTSCKKTCEQDEQKAYVDNVNSSANLDLDNKSCKKTCEQDKKLGETIDLVENKNDAIVAINNEVNQKTCMENKNKAQQNIAHNKEIQKCIRNELISKCITNITIQNEMRKIAPNTIKTNYKSIERDNTNLKQDAKCVDDKKLDMLAESQKIEKKTLSNTSTSCDDNENNSDSVKTNDMRVKADDKQPVANEMSIKDVEHKELQNSFVSYSSLSSEEKKQLAVFCCKKIRAIRKKSWIKKAVGWVKNIVAPKKDEFYCDKCTIPDVFYDIEQKVKNDAKNCNRIFRLSFDDTKAEEMLEKIINGDNGYSTYDCVGLYKWYIRTKLHGLVPKNLTKSLIQTCIGNMQMIENNKKVLEIMRYLPFALQENKKEVLETIFGIFDDIANNYDTTEMDKKSLMICIAPSLFDSEFFAKLEHVKLAYEIISVLSTTNLNMIDKAVYDEFSTHCKA